MDEELDEQHQGQDSQLEREPERGTAAQRLRSQAVWTGIFAFVALSALGLAGLWAYSQVDDFMRNRERQSEYVAAIEALPAVDAVRVVSSPGVRPPDGPRYDVRLRADVTPHEESLVASAPFPTPPADLNFSDPRDNFTVCIYRADGSLLRKNPEKLSSPCAEPLPEGVEPWIPFDQFVASQPGQE